MYEDPVTGDFTVPNTSSSAVWANYLRKKYPRYKKANDPIVQDDSEDDGIITSDPKAFHKI